MRCAGEGCAAVEPFAKWAAPSVDGVERVVEVRWSGYRIVKWDALFGEWADQLVDMDG